MKSTHEVIFCIVNSGFSDLAMEAARNAGAKGGTVFNARGTASPEAEKLFNISIQHEKETIMILVNKTITDNVLKALYETVGSNSEAQGIAFSVPVDNTVGITKEKIEKI